MRTTNLLLTLHAHLEQSRSPSPKGEGRDEVGHPSGPKSGNHQTPFDSDIWIIILNKRPLSSGEGWDEVGNQIQISENIRVELQIPPSHHQLYDYTQRG